MHPACIKRADSHRHGNTDICLLERRRIVDAVTGHAHTKAHLAQHLHNQELVLRVNLHQPAQFSMHQWALMNCSMHKHTLQASRCSFRKQNGTARISLQPDPHGIGYYNTQATASAASSTYLCKAVCVVAHLAILDAQIFGYRLTHFEIWQALRVKDVGAHAQLPRCLLCH